MNNRFSEFYNPRFMSECDKLYKKQFKKVCNKEKFSDEVDAAKIIITNYALTKGKVIDYSGSIVTPPQFEIRKYRYNSEILRLGSRQAYRFVALIDKVKETIIFLTVYTKKVKNDVTMAEIKKLVDELPEE